VTASIETVSIETGTTPLDGLLYRPAGEPIGTVQLMHGNTMNFYVGPPRFFAPALAKRGFACLAYNRRGHDVLSNRNSRRLEGGAYQTIAESIEDNRLARAWLDERSFSPPIVIGHSNGGMLGVRHVADHPDTPGLVLLSAHRGGKDLMRLMADNGLMAADRFDEITQRALAMVAAGRGDELMLVPGWWYVISARTYVEFLHHCPDIIEWSSSIPCRTLFVRGGDEPADLYPAEEIATASNHPVDIAVLDGCGHYYTDCGTETISLVGSWLDEHALGEGRVT